MPPTPNVTLVGTFSDLQGNLISSGTVTAVLAGYGSDIPKVNGAVLDVTTVSATVSNGTFSLTLYGNDQITPLSTYYMLTVPYPMGNGTAGGTTTKPYRITGGGSFDLSTLNPLSSQIVVNTPANSATPVVFNPITHQFITGMNSQGQFSSAQPSLSDLSNATTAVLNWNGDTGLSRGAAGEVLFGNGTQGDFSGQVTATNVVQVANKVRLGPSGCLFGSGGIAGWSSSTTSSGSLDTGLSRDSAGVIDVGNGTQGDTSGNLQLNKITKYAGVATVANGVPALVAKYDATAQAANITSTLLYAVPASAGGFYRVSFYEVVTQAATSSSALPGFFVSATDNDTNVAYSSTVIGSSTNGSGNTVGVTNSFTSGSGINNAVLNLKGGTNLNFLTSNYASTGATPMQYAIHVKLEYLGN